MLTQICAFGCTQTPAHMTLALRVGPVYTQTSVSPVMSWSVPLGNNVISKVCQKVTQNRLEGSMTLSLCVNHTCACYTTQRNLGALI